MFLSRDGQYLLMGGDGGVVSVWQVHDLKQLFTYPGCDAGIRSMAVSHDQRYTQSSPVGAAFSSTVWPFLFQFSAFV